VDYVGLLLKTTFIFTPGTLGSNEDTTWHNTKEPRPLVYSPATTARRPKLLPLTWSQHLQSYGYALVHEITTKEVCLRVLWKFLSIIFYDTIYHLLFPKSLTSGKLEERA